MNAKVSAGREVVVPEDTQLISTTDLKGRILYANQAFCSIAGFSLQELINQPHSIVRHPDMPKEAFGNLWESLHQDQAWRGIVKNRCKNGDYYWVDAYVTPLYENGQKIGYQSVRVRPSNALKAKADTLYKAINQGRLHRMLRGGSIKRSSMLTTTVTAMLGAAAAYAAPNGVTAAIVAALTGVGVSACWIWHTRRVGALCAVSRKIASNPLIKLVYCNSADELGDIELAMLMQAARNRTVLGRLRDIGSSLNSVVGVTEQAIKEADRGVGNQELETEQVAAAVNQMTTATQEIAHNINQTNDASQNAVNVTENGRHELTDVVQKTEHLSRQVKHAADTTLELQEQALKIENVLSVISEIADQTNLLALNAAIEAARAGEHGRGFAVVSDEVRTLANRTQKSTEEIRTVIEQVQSAVARTVKLMHSSQEETEKVMQATRRTDSAFIDVQNMMAEVSDRCVQIATASEEQTSVVEDICKNVDRLRALAGENRQASQKTSDVSNELKALVASLDSMSKAFER